MFKIELENRDFRKSLYSYIVDAGKKRAATGCWHGAATDDIMPIEFPPGLMALMAFIFNHILNYIPMPAK